jgi:predicted methyltransferase
MTTQAKLDLIALAILETLAEVGTGSPESILYMATGLGLTEWQALRETMQSLGLITVTSYYVEITDRGACLVASANLQSKKESE